MLTGVENDLFERKELLHALFYPVMDAIHELEADKHMLSLLRTCSTTLGLVSKIFRLRM